MKRPFILYLSVLVFIVSCSRPAPRKQNSARPFKNEVLLKMTPVKDQGRSSLCWLYGMTATIETEHLMKGDSVNLSIDYLTRQFLHDATIRYYFSGDNDPISTRGMASMTIHLLNRYGAEPYQSYHGQNVNYSVISRKLMLAADASKSLDELNTKIDDVLDNAVDYLPKIVFMLGAEYTPLEFAHSMIMPYEYVQLTSFTHHPFGSNFALEVPDNKLRDEYLNVPLDTLMTIITTSLRQSHPVCWEGDTSEKGFSFSEGVARVPAGYGTITQQKRQQAFEQRRTTDDHVMALVGLAHDSKGRRYFIAKNSWGTNNPYGGLMYLSEDYVRMKTIAIIVPTVAAKPFLKR